MWVGVLGCGDTPVNVVSLLVRLRGRALGCGDAPVNVVKLLCFKNVTWFKALCAGGGNVTFFGYYIWLQSDGAFYYLRLDKCSFTVGMFCIT